MDGFKRLPARFFRLDSGRVPVLEWLRGLSPADRQRIGYEICNVEVDWPVGMPLCRAIVGHRGLWEVRVSLSGRRIGRVFFCTRAGRMVLLHGFIKKTQKTPAGEIAIAVQRMRDLL